MIRNVRRIYDLYKRTIVSAANQNAELQFAVNPIIYRGQSLIFFLKGM